MAHPLTPHITRACAGALAGLVLLAALPAPAQAAPPRSKRAAVAPRNTAAPAGVPAIHSIAQASHAAARRSRAGCVLRGACSVAMRAEFDSPRERRV